MLPDLSHAFKLEPIPTRPAPQGGAGQAQEGESVIERVTGKKNPTLQDVLTAVRSNPPRNGERHTFFTPLAAAVWVRWKLRGVLALRELMLEVWGDEADEDEIDAILESAMLKFQASANAKQKKRSHEEIFEKLLEAGRGGWPGKGRRSWWSRAGRSPRSGCGIGYPPGASTLARSPPKRSWPGPVRSCRASQKTT